MTEKAGIVKQLGEQALLLPGLVADALAANERLKLRITVLQEAAMQARSPGRTARYFEHECRLAGVSDAECRAAVTGAKAISAASLLIPGAKAQISSIRADLTSMMAPLEVSGTDEYRSLSARLAGLVPKLPPADDDTLTFAAIDDVGRIDRDGVDSVHLLVMDMHKAINRLAGSVAAETIDGAQAYRIDSWDRARIRAFMIGLNRTSRLAFGHPGLTTTATRTDGRLTIQNDIGVTDAHVLIVHVEPEAVTITYTDVHRPRAKFFMSLFDGKGVTWNALGEQHAAGFAKNLFYLITGRFAAANVTALDDFLELLGSRIVFLIDWNKARKALETFVDNDAAVELLIWAAFHDFGHRAFLELGGADFVFEAVRHMPGNPVPYGARLDRILGAGDSAAFLRDVLRLTSEGLSAGRSIRLIRDEVQAALLRLFDTVEAEILHVLVKHLGLTRMLAAAVSEALIEERTQHSDRSALADLSKRLEEKADRLTVKARELCVRVHDGSKLRQCVDASEDAMDALDEGAFLLSLMPHARDSTNVSTLAALADVVIDSAGHLVSAAEAAARLPESNRADTEDSLRKIDAVSDAERRADKIEREAFRALIGVDNPDARFLVLGVEIARALETTTDHLAHAALYLRDRVLEDLSE